MTDRHIDMGEKGKKKRRKVRRERRNKDTTGRCPDWGKMRGKGETEKRKNVIRRQSGEEEEIDKNTGIEDRQLDRRERE